jgi:putative aldouronate transport system substrate-binding protein
MKKTGLALLALCLALAMLPLSASGAEELAPVKLIWYMGGTVQADHDLVMEAINEITREKINAELEINWIDWGNYGSQMAVYLASGEPMDLIYTSNWANDFYADVAKGAYKELDMAMIEELGPWIVKGVLPAAWDAAKVGGKLYAIPNTQVQARWPGVIMQNKYLEKYGFDPESAKTLDDFTPYFEQIAKGEPGIFPIDIFKGNSNILTYYITAMGLEYFSDNNPFGIYLNDDETRLVNMYETPEIRDFLLMIRKWYETGIVRPDAATISDLTGEKSNGMIANIFAVNNPDTLANQASLMGLVTEDLSIKVLSDPFLSTASVVATMTAIHSGSPNAERAIMLYDLLYNEEDTRLINLISFGVEGVHYDLIGDDLVGFRQGSGYRVDCGWEYGNLFNCLRIDPNQPTWRPLGEDINANAIVSKLMGFGFDPTPVKSELAQITSVLDEYKPALFTGSVDVDEYLGQLNEKLGAAGAEAVRVEMQRQIDEWKASK